MWPTTIYFFSSFFMSFTFYVYAFFDFVTRTLILLGFDFFGYFQDMWRWCENKRSEEEMGFIRPKGHINTYAESFNLNHWFNHKAINYSYNSFPFKFNSIIALTGSKSEGECELQKGVKLGGWKMFFFNRVPKLLIWQT